MKITQADYISFYNDIQKELIDTIERKKGYTLLYMPIKYSAGSSCCSPDTYSNGKIVNYKPKDEVISLNEYKYGEYIDKNYMLDFKARCVFSDTYSKEKFSNLIKKIASEIYTMEYEKNDNPAQKRGRNKKNKIFNSELFFYVVLFSITIILFMLCFL